MLLSVVGFFCFPSLSKGFVSPSNHGTTHLTTKLSSIDDSRPVGRAGLRWDGLARHTVTMSAVFALVGAAGFVSRRTGGVKRVGVAPVRVLPKALEGTGGPMPDYVWDPCGLMNGRSEEQVLHWRAVELKHARVSMLAVVGWLHVSAGWHFIGDFAAGFRVSDDPLVNVTQVPMGGMWQLVAGIMGLEWVSSICPPPKSKPWDVLGWDPIIVETPEWKETQLKELNNGRLAMLGILGLIGQDAFTGDYAAWIHQPNFGQSNPLNWRGEPPFEMPPLYPPTGMFQ